ncbi:hypothetical protein [Blautia wexlerae]|uniref:hypothetical protein n=1 Tax=Blautia wexlerae TaxID=418240 RepID=UPI0034A3381E
MGDIWQIVLGVITSLGGCGVIFTVIIKFSSNIIAERLQEKYNLKLNKELEAYKSALESKTYISKTKFDAEFEIYRSLSKAFFEMVKDVSVMIPCGVSMQIADEEKKREHDNKLYNIACKSCVVAQDTLNGNAPFISEEIFNKYTEIMKLCNMQLGAFERRWNVLYIASQKEKETFTHEDYARTEEINDKFKAVNNQVRAYLSKLDVIN